MASPDRPSMSEIQRRIPSPQVAQAGPSNPAGVNQPRQGGETKGAPTTKRDADRPWLSNPPKRIPDTGVAKSGPTVAAEGPKGIGDRAKPADLGRRVSETPGAKPAGTIPTRKGGSGDAASREPIAKPGAVKPSVDRPDITEIRKRIPDVPGGKPKMPETAKGKAKPPDGQVKSGDGVSGSPGKMPFPRDRLPDMAPKPYGPKPEGGTKSGMKIASPQGARGPQNKPAQDPSNVRFPDRVKRGDFDALARGAVGQKLNLAEQYRLAQHGDVARRMALHQPRPGGVHVTNITNVTQVTNVYGARPFHGHPEFRHRGWVSPLYHRHCFEYRCWFSPVWYWGVWWYPRWGPWVHWSWHYHCRPWWDPRPIWCRPVRCVVVVEPWVVWSVPVWTPLPEVAAGTWVEVQRPVVPEEQFDLQLLAVRFVDPGHPDEKLGPRYRVWVRNNSQQAVTRPFDVRLFVTPGEHLDPKAPQAAVRVTSIEAGATQSIDLRLPFLETGAAGADDKPPFAFLHVLVDANREIRDANLANNGAKLPIAEALPVDPAAFETDPKSVPAGGELVVAGEGFGPEPGKAILHLGNIEMEAEVLGWYDLGVRLRMPDLPLAEATVADLVIVRGDGAAANPVTVRVTPPDRMAPPSNAPPQINAPQ